MELSEKDILKKLKKELIERGIEINKLLESHPLIYNKLMKDLEVESNGKKIGCITLAIVLGESDALAKVYERIKYLEKSCD